MGKQRKKRNKAYNGIDAAVSKPTVTKITAANRNRASQWWFDRKRVAKPVIIASAVIIIVLWLLIELIRIVGGS